jgi:hypothetical protein
MAVHFECKDPRSLLDAFDARVTQLEPKGKITTWEKHTDGRHYTHRAPEWSRKAWLQPVIESHGRLTFQIIKPTGMNISTVVYAYYHGHLIETFLAHFDSMFSSAQASAMPASGDNI